MKLWESMCSFSLYTEFHFVIVLKYSEISNAYAFFKKNLSEAFEEQYFKNKWKTPKKLSFSFVPLRGFCGEESVLRASTWHSHFDFSLTGLAYPSLWLPTSV